ncbi:MAG: ISAzo13 family transposase [Holosporales bacterium]|jgi:hypothetical protein|nr:ISAzo13 family transposase [Holosporales bacterium]
MDRAEIKQIWEDMSPSFNEKQRRTFAASLAKTFGYGGATAVHEVTGIALNTITAGKKDLAEDNSFIDQRIRKPGGGPKLVEYYHPTLQDTMRQIVDSSTYGNPEKLLSYTTMSVRKISEELKNKYHIDISHVTVGTILADLGYSKQGNKKMLQVGKPHPDRNAQFEFINATAKEFIDAGEPVISVDTEKKELLGNFKNNGKEYRKKRDARKVLDHDFPLTELGKIAPYGVYNLNFNTGFVNLGISHDTAEFAVESISRWWECIGRHTFPEATKLLVTCDCGGSNGNRLKLWKYQLFQLAKRIHLDIHVTHFPAGTSKFNKIEHRLFCYISQNWAGKPLIDIQTVVNLIGSTITKKGLKVICIQDDNVYKLAQKVSDADYDKISLIRIAPFEQWNYIIKGVSKRKKLKTTNNL